MPANYGNIDFTKTGSLTIHKFMTQPPNAGDGDIGTGAQPGDDGFADPVEGVVFTVYPLLKGGAPVDLSQPTAWDGLSQLQPGAPCAAPTGYTLGAGQVMPATSDTGESTLALTIGLYQVCETDVSGAKVDGESVQITQRATPFILVIPTPYENGWIYDVHAFPKNGGFKEVAKSILPQPATDLGLGSVVKFPVTIEIPHMPEGMSWTQGAVTDVFDNRFGTLGVESVKVVNQGGQVQTTLAKDTDYAVLTPADTNGIAVNFTAAGLGVFDGNAFAGDKVEVVFTATVKELGSGQDSGKLPNTAGVWTNTTFNTDGSGWDNPPAVSNTVYTNWGSFDVFKHAADSNKAPLKGAEFEIYAASGPYPTAEGGCQANISGSALAVDGKTTFTTDADGKLTIAGLFVSDSVQDPKNGDFRCYVLKETKAPAGYVLPDNANTAVKVQIGTGTTTVEIANAQQSVPQLPVTGAAGKVLLVAGAMGGTLLLVGLVLVNKRRTKDAQRI